MRIVEKYARAKDCWINDLQDWDYRSVNKMWMTINPEFEAEYCQTKRPRELTWKSVYNKMSTKNTFGNKRNKKSNE